MAVAVAEAVAVGDGSGSGTRSVVVVAANKNRKQSPFRIESLRTAPGPKRVEPNPYMEAGAKNRPRQGHKAFLNRERYTRS